MSISSQYENMFVSLRNKCAQAFADHKTDKIVRIFSDSADKLADLFTGVKDLKSLVSTRAQLQKTLLFPDL